MSGRDQRDRAGVRIVGRYALCDQIGAGGMAAVHVGRLLGPAGFARTVAIKRLYDEHAHDDELVSILLDEARLVSRIRHSNVVPILDVLCEDGEVLLVMDYVVGESLAALLRTAGDRGERMPWRIATGIIAGALHGLHAAHRATTPGGEPLDIVHRDVSPQNILVGADGTARAFDFGVAKAVGRVQTTRAGQVKGKLGYMAPEYLLAKRLGPAADIFAASVVLWEALAGRALFHGDDKGDVVTQVLSRPIEPPSEHAPGLPRALVALVMRGLEREPSMRFGSAEELASALEVVGIASASEIAEYVTVHAASALADRAAIVASVEGRVDLDLDRIEEPREPIRRAPRSLRPPPTTEDSRATVVDSPAARAVAEGVAAATRNSRSKARVRIAAAAMLACGVAVAVVLGAGAGRSTAREVEAEAASIAPLATSMTPSAGEGATPATDAHAVEPATPPVAVNGPPSASAIEPRRGAPARGGGVGGPRQGRPCDRTELESVRGPDGIYRLQPRCRP